MGGGFGVIIAVSGCCCFAGSAAHFAGIDRVTCCGKARQRAADEGPEPLGGCQLRSLKKTDGDDPVDCRGKACGAIIQIGVPEKAETAATE